MCERMYVCMCGCRSECVCECEAYEGHTTLFAVPIPVFIHLHFLRLSFCHWLSERKEADPPSHRPVTNLPLCSK